MPKSTITFRANKTEALTYSEMDKNFGSFYYSSSLSANGQNLNLHYTSSANVPINSGSVTYSLMFLGVTALSLIFGLVICPVTWSTK